MLSLSFMFLAEERNHNNYSLKYSHFMAWLTSETTSNDVI